MAEFIQLFDSLSTPSSESDRSAFSAIRIEGGKEKHLCKNTKNQPILLLSTEHSGGKKLTSYKLRHLCIEHDVFCRIVDPAGKLQSGRYTLLCCLSSDRDIQEYFLRVVQMLINTLSVDAEASEIATSLEKLVALFSAMSQPSKKSIHGLWGELFLIINSNDPFVMLNAWHDRTMDEIDFSINGQQLEVKCSANGERKHHFSLDQLNPPTKTSRLIASMLLKSSTGGKGLKELWDELRSIASGNNDLLFKVERICANTLGSDWQDGTDWKFDERKACDSLLFFNARDIPQIAPSLPKGVSGVHFCSDLSHARSLERKDLPNFGSLYESALPK